MSKDVPQELQDKLEVIDRLVQDYFKAWWDQGGVHEQGDYIASWAIVANFGNINEAVPSGYIVESVPAMAPHTMKGLFLEGVDWVIEAQQGDPDD